VKTMLEVNNLNVCYGNLQVLWDISLSIAEGEVVAVVGANGAGKSTLLNTIFGLLEPDSGTIEFQGHQLVGRSSHKIGKLGLAYVPEGGRPFREMSVIENLEMGAYTSSAWKTRKETIQKVFEIFPRLEERQDQLTRTLSGGERQMLAVGRALMSMPTLIVLDEPSIGLAPLLVANLFRVIEALGQQGVTVLVIEQNVKQSLEIADHAYVLESGRITLEGDSRRLLQEESIKKAYLGL
jgi:branched-chain amino acid transport system ATP-binding protein